VPSAAIQHSPEGTFVYIVKKDNTAAIKQVALGLSDGEDTAVASGLAAGDLVVTDGVDKLQSGSKVTPQNPEAPGKKSRGMK
jgi:membrane fusion protein, multidrug efflux system